MKKIQRVELTADSGAPIHCPFCGLKICNSFDDEQAGTWVAGEPCEHTLFCAHDEAFEYKSPLFEENVKAALGMSDSDDIEDHADHSIDEITDAVTLPDSIKIAIYTGPPAQFGSYIGFVAPVSSE